MDNKFGVWLKADSEAQKNFEKLREFFPDSTPSAIVRMIFTGIIDVSKYIDFSRIESPEKKGESWATF